MSATPPRVPVPLALPPPERGDSILLRDGRRLAWWEWGPAEGDPVLFCTGAATSGRLGFGADFLEELGLRLLAIDRPGLGRSDPHPSKTLGSWVDDVTEVVEGRGLGCPLGVGFSQGAPFALALAGRGLLSGLALVSGQDQLSHPALRPLLHPEVAGMLAAIERDPAGFARDLASRADAEGMWRLVLGMSSEHDRAVYRRDEFSRPFRQALEAGFAQGAEGYVRDLVNTLGPWPVPPEEVTVPVDLWYGAQDASPVHSPDFGATLAARLPEAWRTVEPDEGGSILWTRSQDILARLGRSRAGEAPPS